MDSTPSCFWCVAPHCGENSLDRAAWCSTCQAKLFDTNGFIESNLLDSSWECLVQKQLFISMWIKLISGNDIIFLLMILIKNTNNDSDSKASHICRSAISLHWKRLVLHEDIYCTWWWYTIFKWMRHSTSTIVKGFKAKSLDAVCQSILTFKFNALLPREFTCIHQKQHCVSAFAY